MNQTSPLKVAIIIASTRDTRFGVTPARWFAEFAGRREDVHTELVDLKSFDLPFFNEDASNLWVPSKDPRAVAWQRKVAGFDAYVVVTPEYNRSMPASLKNAFDQAYLEWNKKPIGFVGYGSVGAARAIEHARGTVVELQMVSVRTAVHIGGSEFYKVHPSIGNQPFASIEDSISGAASDLLDQIAWWGDALRAKRTQSPKQTS